MKGIFVYCIAFMIVIIGGVAADLSSLDKEIIFNPNTMQYEIVWSEQPTASGGSVSCSDCDPRFVNVDSNDNATLWNLTAQYLCLIGDTCETSWPAGGSVNGTDLNVEHVNASSMNVTELHVDGTLFGSVNDSIFFAYDANGGTAVANTWTNLTFDTEVRKDGDYTHSADGHIIRLDSASRYLMQFECSILSTGTARYTADWRLIKNGAALPGSQSRSYHRTTDDGEDNANIFYYLYATAGDQIAFQSKCDVNSVCTTIANSCRVFITMVDNSQGIKGEKGAGGPPGISDGNASSICDGTRCVLDGDGNCDEYGSDCGGGTPYAYGRTNTGALKCRAGDGSGGCTGETGTVCVYEGDPAETPYLYDWNNTFMRKVAANLFELKGVAMIPLVNYTVSSNFTFRIKNIDPERVHIDYIKLNQRCYKGKIMGYKSYMPDQLPLGKDDEMYIVLEQGESGWFSFSGLHIPVKCESTDFINYQVEIGGYYEKVNGTEEFLYLSGREYIGDSKNYLSFAPNGCDEGYCGISFTDGCYDGTTCEGGGGPS